MKIDKSKIGEFGPFEVYETEDRKIRRKFIDVETGLLIIMEQEGNLENKYTGDSHFITINPNTGDIIEIENRGDYINYAEIEEQDVELRIKWKKRRMPWKNGNEYFEFDIFSEEGSKPIEYKYISAFSDEPQKSVSEYYKDYLEGKELRKKEIEDYHKSHMRRKLNFGQEIFIDR